MFGSLPSKLPQQIAFLLVPNFSMIAFTSAVEPLRLANRVAGRELYRWHLFSPDGAPISASNGIQLTPSGAVDQVMGYETVILCSGIDGHLFDDKTVFAALRRADRQGADIGALCTGSHILARANMLNGYRCTIHWENLASFSENFPEIETTSELSGKGYFRDVFFSQRKEELVNPISRSPFWNVGGPAAAAAARLPHPARIVLHAAIRTAKGARHDVARKLAAACRNCSRPRSNCPNCSGRGCGRSCANGDKIRI